MKRNIASGVLAAFAILAAATPLLAHHSWPVDMSHEVTVKGTVTDYSWGNPHVMIGLEVRTENGATEKWSVGGPSTSRMEGNGWHKNTLKLGDVIIGTGVSVLRWTEGPAAAEDHNARRQDDAALRQVKTRTSSCRSSPSGRRGRSGPARTRG